MTALYVELSILTEDAHTLFIMPQVGQVSLWETCSIFFLFYLAWDPLCTDLVDDKMAVIIYSPARAAHH